MSKGKWEDESLIVEPVSKWEDESLVVEKKSPNSISSDGLQPVSPDSQEQPQEQANISNPVVDRARQSIERRRQLLEKGTSNIIASNPVYQDPKNQETLKQFVDRKNLESRPLNRLVTGVEENVKNIGEGVRETISDPSSVMGNFSGNLMRNFISQSEEGKSNVLGDIGAFAKHSAESTAESAKKLSETEGRVASQFIKDPSVKNVLTGIRDVSIGATKMGVDAMLTGASLTPAGAEFVTALHGLKTLGVPKDKMNYVMSLATNVAKENGIIDENSPDWEKQLASIFDVALAGIGIAGVHGGVKSVAEAVGKVTKNDIKAAVTHPENPELAQSEKKILDLQDDHAQVPEMAKPIIEQEIQKAEAEKQAIEQQEVAQTLDQAHKEATNQINSEIKSELDKAIEMPISETAKEAIKTMSDELKIGDTVELSPERTDLPKEETIYHGTTAEAAKAIEESGFDISKSADGTIWFTNNKTKIEGGEVTATGKGGIIERKIDESKLKLGGWEETDKYGTDELIAMGYDGLKLVDKDQITYQIFNPEKLDKIIKPKTENIQAEGAKEFSKLIEDDKKIIAKRKAKILPKVHEFNPAAWKPDPSAHYRMIGEKGFKDAMESGVLRPNQEPVEGSKFEETWFNRGKPHDDFETQKSTGVKGGYSGDYMVEVKGETAKKLDSHIGYSKTKEPIDINSPDVTFYKKDALFRYKKVPKTHSEGQKKPQTEEYRGKHQIKEPPFTADKITEAGGHEDFFETPSVNYDLSEPSYKESYRALKQIKNNPDAEITIYRAVPKGVDKINEGDWVSLSKTYAKEHGMHEADASQDMPVISMKVKAKDIGWDGNDINEFSYNPKRQTPENVVTPQEKEAGSTAGSSTANVQKESEIKPSEKQSKYNTGKTSVEKWNEDPIDFSSEEEMDRFILENSENPKEIINTYLRSQNDVSEKGYKEQMISENIGKIRPEGFYEWGDRNNVTKKMSNKYFDPKGRHIDDLAQEMTETAGIEITPQDIADYITDEDKQRLTATPETSFQKKLKIKFQELTGESLNKKTIKKVFNETQKSKSGLVEGEKVSQPTTENVEGTGGEKPPTEGETAITEADKLVGEKPPVEPPKEEGGEGKKKSLLGRVYEGKTPEEIKASVEKHGLTYTEETHVEAEQKAKDFIDDVGIDNALEAARQGEVEGGAYAFVWAKAIDEVHKQYLTEKDLRKKADLLDKESALIDEFDKAMRKKGQEISALLPAYQTADLGYKIGAILNRAKEANQGEVPADTVARLTELSEKLDEANKKYIELQQKQKEQQPEIIQIKTKPRASLTPEKLSRKQELSAKYRGALNDITRVITLVGEKDFREYASLVFEEAAGDFKYFAKEMINNVGKEIQEHLPKLFKDLGGKDPEMANIQKNLKNQIGEYERKLREKDFGRKKKGEPPTLDEETFNMKVERNKLKDQVDLEIEKLALKNRPTAVKNNDLFLDVVNLPKSLVASADLSAPLRQGAVLTARHPILGGRAAVTMFRHAFSESKAVDWMARLKASRMYETMKKAGLYFAEPTAKLSAKEEQFISNIAHKIPIWGRVVKGSERGYTGFLNKLRADVFTQFHDALVKEGVKGKELEKELESFANFVNNASGRGSLGRFEEATPLLNAAFFSPRYVISRVNLLNPVKYATMPKRARMEALKTMGSYIGIATMVLALAKAGGAEVEDDPHSADFGKIKVGNTRYDIWAGFQQWIRLLTTVVSGEKKTIAGQTKKLGEGYKEDDEYDILTTFARTKFSPLVGAAINAKTGKDVVGNSTDVKSEAVKLVIPLWQSDLMQIAKEEGWDKATVAGIASFFGVGVQQYDKKDQKQPNSNFKTIFHPIKKIQRQSHIMPKRKK